MNVNNIERTAVGEVPLRFCLHLLLKILESENDNNKGTWLESCELLPLILCLSDILDRCRRLWDTENYKETLRDLVIKVIHNLSQVQQLDEYIDCKLRIIYI